MALDCSPELKIACGSDGVWLARCQLKMAILFGCHGKTYKWKICEAPAGKKTMCSTSRERKPCESPEGKEDPL